jgi:hypothetical protein
MIGIALFCGVLILGIGTIPYLLRMRAANSPA